MKFVLLRWLLLSRVSLANVALKYKIDIATHKATILKHRFEDYETKVIFSTKSKRLLQSLRTMKVATRMKYIRIFTAVRQFPTCLTHLSSDLTIPTALLYVQLNLRQVSSTAAKWKTHVGPMRNFILYINVR